MGVMYTSLCDHGRSSSRKWVDVEAESETRLIIHREIHYCALKLSFIFCEWRIIIMYN